MITIDQTVRNYMQSAVPFDITEWGPFEEIVQKREIRKGDHFFQHLERTDEMALITRGLFRLYLIDNDSEERTFSFLSESDFIIEFFLNWENSPTSTMISVQALEDSEIYCVKYTAFLALMKRVPQWSDVYREILQINYRVKTAREIEFVLYNAKQRLQMFMQNTKINLARIPKAYLASYLGIAPPSLSRLFRELKN